MKLRKIIFEILSIFFCGGDIKLSVKMVWESNTSPKELLCKCKPTARDFGKVAWRWIKMKKLTKVFGN